MRTVSKKRLRAGIGLIVFAWAGATAFVSTNDVEGGATLFFLGIFIAGVVCISASLP